MIALKVRDSSPNNSWIRPDWLISGQLYLDVDSDFQISISKEIQTLTDINKIATETVVNTSLPATNKNLAVLRPAMDVEMIDNTYPEFEVDVEVGHRTLNQNKLKVLKYEKENNRIEIELTDADTSWITKVKDVYLDELPFGTFTYSWANLETNWTTLNDYQPGDPGYYFGFCWYGYLNNKKTFAEENFRPLVHALAVMEKGFCAAGWGVSCPLLETTTGRKIIHYLNKKEFASDEEAVNNSLFKATTEGSKIQYGPSSQNKPILYYYTELSRRSGAWTKIKFNVENLDHGGNYDPLTGIYQRACIATFIAELDLSITILKKGAFASTSAVEFRLVHEQFDGTINVLDYPAPLTNEAGHFEDMNLRLTLIAENVYLHPGDKIYVEYFSRGGSVIFNHIKNGSSFYNKDLTRIIQSGDTIDVGKNLRHDSFLDYLKGICHIFNFHIYTDWSDQKVYFLTPYDLDYFGDSITGYFNSSLNDLRQKQIKDSESYEQLEKIAKNRIYSFKKSTDAKIKSYKWDQYEPYSRFVDNGFDKKDSDQNEVFENPYFEATFSADTGLEAFGGVLELPWMVDNLENKLSYDIAPRILIAHGNNHQFYEVNTGGVPGLRAAYARNGSTKELYNIFPLVAQKLNKAIDAIGAWPGATLVIPEEKITYGWHEDDLYQMIYKRYDRDFRDVPLIHFKAKINPEDYFSEFFRKRALISSPNIHTGDLMGRLVKITNYNPVKGEAEFSFKPDVHTLDECIGFDVPLSCLNYPYITLSKVGTIYTFAYAGSIPSTINTVTWQYRYIDVKTWTAGNVVTTPVKNTVVRMTMTFTDGCPPITKEYIIKIQLEPVVTLTKEGNKVTAEENGTHGLTVSNTEILWSTDGVNNWQPYTSDKIDLDHITSDYLFFKAIVTYSTGTKVESPVNSVRVQPDEDDCPNPDLHVHPPSATYAKTAQGYTLYKTGEYSGHGAVDIIRFRESGKNQEWEQYGNETLLSLMKCWEFQRVIIWCEEGCPPYCSTPGITDCGSCTQTATVNIAPVSVTCTHEQKWENPDIPASATWKVEPLDDSIYHIPRIRTWIEQNAGAPVEIQERDIIWDRWNFRTEFAFSWNNAVTVEDIGIHVSTGGVLGTGHTLAVDVTYTTGDSNETLSEALRQAINRELAALGYSPDEHFILYITVTGSATKTVNIGFVARHSPAGVWIGAQNNVDTLTLSSGGPVTASGKEFQLISTTQPILENYTPYETQFKVRFRVSTVNYFLDDSASDFYNLVANASTPILTDTLSAAITDTGKKFTLTATFSGCPGTSTFVWQFAGVKKGRGGEVLSYDDEAIVYLKATNDVIVVGDCNSAGYCNYEKRVTLTV